MPKLYNGMAGQELITEVNDYSIDSRGKVKLNEDTGKYEVDNAAHQRIDNKIVVPQLYLGDIDNDANKATSKSDVSNLILNEGYLKESRFLQEYWNTLKTSDFNLQRYEDGSLKKNKITLQNDFSSFLLTGNTSYVTSKLYTKTFNITADRFSTIGSNYDYLYFPYNIYVDIIDGDAAFYGNGEWTLYKDNEIIDSKTYDLDRTKSSVHEYDDFFPSESKPVYLKNIKDLSGTYKITIQFNDCKSSARSFSLYTVPKGRGDDYKFGMEFRYVPRYF